jgi:hypothetical protein
VRRVVTFGPEMPPSGLVPPLSFFPTATVCSTSCLPGLLRPGADHGVRQVAAFATTSGPFPAVPLCDCTGFPPGPRRVPEGIRSGLHRSGLFASSEEGTFTPSRRPALPLAAWAFPLALHPSKLFPCRQPVPRQPCRASASRSVPVVPGEPGSSFPCVTLQSSGPGHRGPFPLAVARDSCAPSGYRPRTDGACPVCRGRSLDLRALFHRQVRNDGPTFPSDHRPMLPWASSIEGLLSPRVDRSRVAVADVPEHPTADTEASCATRGGRASNHSGRGRFPWRTSSVVFCVSAVCRLLAFSRQPRLPGSSRPDRHPLPKEHRSRRSDVGVPSSGLARRRLRGDSVSSWPEAPVLARPEGVARADGSARWSVPSGALRRSEARAGSTACSALFQPKPKGWSRRSVGGGTCWLRQRTIIAQRQIFVRVPAVAKASAAAVRQDPRAEALGVRYLGADGLRQLRVPAGAGPAGAEQPLQGCLDETVSFPVASWATPESGRVRVVGRDAWRADGKGGWPIPRCGTFCRPKPSAVRCRARPALGQSVWARCGCGVPSPGRSRAGRPAAGCRFRAGARSGRPAAAIEPDAEAPGRGLRGLGVSCT